MTTILKSRLKEDSVIEAGLDEAGRGCFWGPLMAGALIWPPESEWTDAHKKLAPHIKDSKKIAPKKRESLCDEIQKLAVAWGVGEVSAKEIDEQGITWANQEAFRRAISQLKVKPGRIVIDGVLRIPDYTEITEQETTVDGDATYLHIAGASILAKVTHDRWIKEYCKEYPQCQERYSLESGHGYGTAKHREGLRTYGAHELHRRTFVYNWIPASDTNTIHTTKHKHFNLPAISEEKCLIKLPPS